MLRLRGGGKKRKKKTYTKPKKVKHVHKAVELAVLKFYRVDDDGKVQRLRKSCPGEECGVGVRMAVHKDRFYCGRCSRTVSQASGPLSISLFSTICCWLYLRAVVIAYPWLVVCAYSRSLLLTCPLIIVRCTV